MVKRKHSKRRFFVVLVALIVSLVAIYVSRLNIEKEMRDQLNGNLRDVANQNEVTIERLLDDKQNILYKIADEINVRFTSIETRDEIWEVISWLKNYSNIYDFKRMGLILPDGSAYTTDGYTAVLLDEPYQYGMQGLANISGVMEDAIGAAEDINVFSMPIFGEDGTTVKGVLFATYRSENFKQLLEVDSFGGEGYGYIVRLNGNVIADSAKSPMYGTTNVFSRMLAYTEDNKEVVTRLLTAMENGESGYETFYTISERSLYYMPLKVDSINQTWYLFTIVPAEVLDEKAESVIFYQDMLVLIIALVIAGLVLFFVATYRKDENTLRNIAYTDPLTNGMNTSAFYELLTRRNVQWGYMVAVDINDFKLVNSVCGIDKGNETIKHIWKVLESNLVPSELAAHIGGDHFVMYLQEMHKDKILERIEKITQEIHALAAELQIININPYFGIYEIKDSKNQEENYNCANQAKRLVKGNKSKNWAFYEEIDFERIIEDRNLVDSFEDAIANNEFEVWYQPKFRAGDLKMVGAEALVRWRKSDGTLIPPYRFIPLFEGNGMITTLDEYIFKKVCAQQKEWRENGYDIIPVSVNISRASLYFGNIVDKYKDIVCSYDIAPAMLPVEITESATGNNQEIKGLVESFREAGFPICLDDFGNGYSTIAMLNLIRFDVIKLDKSLVDLIGDGEGEKLIVYTIRMAKSMGMSITAEGVEAKNQIDTLEKLGCDEIQGFYMSKPLPLDEFTKLMDKWKGKSI